MKYSLAVSILLSALLHACSSIDLPSIEESEKKIALLKPRIQAMELEINSFGQKFSFQRDIVMRVKMSALNSMLTTIAAHSSHDAQITFLGNHPWIEEKKSILGIEYSNRLDIDGGEVKIDLKEFRFQSMAMNDIKAKLTLEGTGAIQVSGKYTGIPASASPEIALALHEEVEFVLAMNDSGYIVLTPKPQQIRLDVRIFVKLLAWKIPWNESQYFALENLIKPIRIPTAITSTIPIPIPSKNPKEKNESVPLHLITRDAVFRAENNILEIQTNVGYRKTK